MAELSPSRAVPSGRHPDPKVWAAESSVLENQPQGAGRSGRRPDLQFLGQLADLGRQIATVPTKGLEGRQLAVLDPAGHRLGDTCKRSATSAGWR